MESVGAAEFPNDLALGNRLALGNEGMNWLVGGLDAVVMLNREHRRAGDDTAVAHDSILGCIDFSVHRCCEVYSPVALEPIAGWLVKTSRNSRRVILARRGRNVRRKRQRKDDEK